MYRVEACLPSCQRYEVNDAHAYLLERLGDIAAAIKLYVHDIERCNSALIQGVLQGDVLLPNVTSPSGRYAIDTHLLLNRTVHRHSMLPRPYMHVAWESFMSVSIWSGQIATICHLRLLVKCSKHFCRCALATVYQCGCLCAQPISWSNLYVQAEGLCWVSFIVFLLIMPHPTGAPCFHPQSCW